MKDVLKYKDFIGSVHYSAEDDCFFGKVEGVDDLVTFEGRDVDELKRSFRVAVEDYVELCPVPELTPPFPGDTLLSIREHGP
jgi:predicted HicB family RNase H-like nuclease